MSDRRPSDNHSIWGHICDATISSVQFRAPTHEERAAAETDRPAALSMLEPACSADAERQRMAPYTRRRSTQLPPSRPHDQLHRKLTSFFMGFVPRSGADSRESSADSSADDEDESADEGVAEPRDNFLGRVHSYSKLMHAHTKGQLDSPSTGTLPSYTRTMHAFTLNQLNHSNVTKSATNSPRLNVAGRHFVLPGRSYKELGIFSLDRLPDAPSNTPEPQAHQNSYAEPMRVRKRSVTEPIPREYAAALVARKDFAVA